MISALAVTVGVLTSSLILSTDPQIELRRIKNDQGWQTEVEASIDITAPRATVWQIMLDCDGARDIVPHLQKCEILEASADDQTDIRRHTIKHRALLTKTINEFRSTYTTPSMIEFERVGGDLKIMEGVWKLEAIAPDVTRVQYEARLALDVPVPTFLVRRAIRKDTTKILESLREVSEQRKSTE